MDKFAKEEISTAIKKTIGSAHLGNLNGTENIEVHVYAQRKRIQLEPNIMVFQKFAYEAATRLSDCSVRVLMLLFSKSGYENFVSMDLIAIAEELHYTQRSVISALNELTKENIVIKTAHPSDKRRNDYFINPIAAWKGNSFARKKQLSKTNPNQTILFPDNKHSELPISQSAEIGANIKTLSE